MTKTGFEFDDHPIEVGDRVVVLKNEGFMSLVSQVGNVSTILNDGLHLVQLESGYSFWAQRDEITRSPYQGEKLVAVNNHD